MATIVAITISTYALGSCVGVAAYDPGVRVGGLLHMMLPDSRLSQPVHVPWFKDPGFNPTLLQTMHQVIEHGAYHRGQAASRLRELGGDPGQHGRCPTERRDTGPGLPSG